MRQQRGLSAILLLTATLVLSCGRTPTEFSPLVRAVGEVRGVLLRFNGLKPLAAENGTYEAWALLQRAETASLGRFQINASGQAVDQNGAMIEEFTSDKANLRDAFSVLITIELPMDSDETPSRFQILQGQLLEGIAQLTVPAPSNIGNATGSYRVFTPTDGPGTNESSGAWAIAIDGSPTLFLPPITAGLLYEAFVYVNGIPVTMGRITAGDEPDTGNYFSGAEPAPRVPGEDFLINHPAFPIDLSGKRLVLTLESLVDDAALPSQLVVLEGVFSGGLRGGEVLVLSNRSGSFPSGTAVLF